MEDTTRFATRFGCIGFLAIAAWLTCSVTVQADPPGTNRGGDSPQRIYHWSLDINPDWGTEGEWAFGQPTGQGGISYGYPDPDNGCTGSNVFGVNLNGDYSPMPGGPYYLTTGPINLLCVSQGNLSFCRWLNVDDPAYVPATVEVWSTGYPSWNQVWASTGTITESTWSWQSYSISPYVDNQPTVYIRWGYEVKPFAWSYSGWNIDDVEIWGTPTDTTPPTPNPMCWASLPAPLGIDTVTMTACTATDADCSPVSYYFDFVTGGPGGDDSDWEQETTYPDTDLLPNTSYTYRVKARDSAALPNETNYSGNADTATLIETPTAVSFGTVTNSLIVLNASGTLTNLTIGSSGLYFDSTTPGGDGGINTWVQTTTDTATDLSPDTNYTFQVKARNQNVVETAYCPTASKATLANVPAAPTLEDPTTTTMKLDVVPNDNPEWTVFVIQCTATDPNDAKWIGQYVGTAGSPSPLAAWQTDAAWGMHTITGLHPYTWYTFAVKARNQEGVETVFGPEASLRTIGFGACCHEDGSCTEGSSTDCDSTFLQGVPCDPSPCCDLSGRPTEVEVCSENTNSGCDLPTPHFETIVCGAPVRGTYWASTTTRDEDWYQVTVTDLSQFTFTVTGELPTAFGLVEYRSGKEGTGNCADLTGDILPYNSVGRCLQGEVVTAMLPAGTYWFWIAPAALEDWPCTYYYTAELACNPNPLSCTPTEAEPCGSDSNGGCGVDPPVFSPIVCGTEVCGTYYSTEETQDTDWYQIVTTAETVFTFRVQGELPTRFGMIEYTPGFEGSGNCTDITGTMSPFGLTDPGEAGWIRTACLPAGAYWFFVAAADTQPWPCTRYYTALLTCASPCPVEDSFESQVQMTVEMFDPPGTKVLNLQSVCRDDLGLVYRQPPPYTTGTDIDTELGSFILRGTDPVDPDFGRLILTQSYGTRSLGKITDVVASGGDFVSGDGFFDVYVDFLLLDAVPQRRFSGVGPFHVVADDLTSLPPYTRTYCWVSGDVDNSGAVNGLDIQGFVDCAIGYDGPEDHCAVADMDCSGTVDVSDIDEFVVALLTCAGGDPCPCIPLIPDGKTQPIGLITKFSHTITQNVCWDAAWDNGRANGDNALNAERRTDGSLNWWVVDDVNLSVTTFIQSIHWCVTEAPTFNWAGTVDIGIWAETDGVGDLPPMSAPLYQLVDVSATRTGVVSHGQMCYEVNTSITLPPLTDRSYFIGVRPVQNLPAGGHSYWWATAGLTGQACYFDDGTGTGWQPSASAFGSDYDVNFCIKVVEGAPFPTGACCYLSGGSYTCDATGNVVECADLGGTYMGDGTTCTFVTCQGACCYTDFTAQGNPYQACAGPVTLAQCVAIGESEFMGPGTSCASDPCVQPTGSCCYGDANCQFCEVLSALECEAKTDYIVWGMGGTCDVAACFPACGACCEGGTDCSEGVEDDCFGVDGRWWIMYEHCTPDPCIFGACCDESTYICTDDVLQSVCEQQGGRFAAGTLCEELTPPCIPLICGQPCPAGSHQEAELCGHNTNNGCDSLLYPPYYHFEEIACPVTICGTTFVPYLGMYPPPERDWYRFSLTQTRDLTITALAEYPLRVRLFAEYGAMCEDYALIDSASTLMPCLEFSLTNPSTLPGTYYLVVDPPVTMELPCYDYMVTIRVTD